MGLQREHLTLQSRVLEVLERIDEKFLQMISIMRNIQGRVEKTGKSDKGEKEEREES